MGTGEAGQSCDSFIGVGVYRIDNASTTANLTGPINPLVTTGIAGTRAFNAVAISEILVNPDQSGQYLCVDHQRAGRHRLLVSAV